MKKIAVSIILILVILSCKTSGEIDKSLKIIRKIETKKNSKTCYDCPNVIYFNMDSLYTSFFDFRKKRINTFVKQKKLKNFTLQETFNFDDVIGLPATYRGALIVKDSVFIFNYNIDSMYVRNNNRFYKIISNFFYVSKNDSMYVTRDASCNIEDFNNFPAYTSYYSKGRLDQLTINDTVLYRRKKSKMIVDLSKSSWEYKDGYCTKAINGFIHCDTLKL